MNRPSTGNNPLSGTSYAHKLTMAFGVVIVLVFISLPVQLWSFHKIGGSSDAGRNAALSLNKVIEGQAHIGNLRVRALEYAYSPGPATFARVELAQQEVSESARSIRRLNSTTPEQHKIAQSILKDATGAVAELRQGGGGNQSAVAFERSIAKVQSQGRQLEQLAQHQVTLAHDQIGQGISSSRLLMFAFFAVTLIAALVLAYRLPRALMARINDLRYAAHRLASGDLTARAEPSGEDEISELIVDFNAMANSLQIRETENRALQQQMRSQLESEQERSTRDPLTSLRNHRYFQDSLKAEIERCSRSGSQVTIAMIDLDNFKQVNDNYGHSEGDAVLLRVTQGITATVRPYDLACRLGGEEFGIIFPETSAEEAVLVLARLAETVKNFGPNGKTATFSGGVASYPRHANNQVDLYRRADEGAYTAKSNGKNQVVIYDPATVVALDSKEMARQRSRDAVLNTAKTLVAAVDAKDPYTRNHSEIVGAYAATIGRAIGLDEETVQQIYQAGLLHDVGKIGIADAILTKPGRLTEDEYQQIKQHSEFSYRIIQNANIEPVATWVRHHHEHWDGSGYPMGLAGEDIPLPSRIILVADAFEAMTSDRVYRRALTVHQAMDELAQNSGKQFDPHLVQIMFRLAEEGILEEIRHRHGLATASDSAAALMQKVLAAQPAAQPTTIDESGQPVHAPADVQQAMETMGIQATVAHHQPVQVAGPILPPAHADSNFVDEALPPMPLAPPPGPPPTPPAGQEHAA